jgi:hypothetical protein
MGQSISKTSEAYMAHRKNLVRLQDLPWKAEFTTSEGIQGRKASGTLLNGELVRVYLYSKKWDRWYESYLYAADFVQAVEG